MFFSQFRLNLGRFGGVRGERTEHTQLFSRTLAGFGLTWHQKVHFSTFDGKLESQCTRNGNKNNPFCPGSLQDTCIIYSNLFTPRWVGNNSWTHPPFFWRYLVPQNVGDIMFVCYFLNIAFVSFSICLQIQNGTSLRKINSRTTTPGTASKS